MVSNKGELKKGHISKTRGQVKKHVNHMSALDIAQIKSRIRMVPNLKLGNHVIDKCVKGLHFKPEMITKVLSNVRKKNIIEYNVTPTKKRSRQKSFTTVYRILRSRT